MAELQQLLKTYPSKDGETKVQTTDILKVVPDGRCSPTSYIQRRKAEEKKVVVKNKGAANSTTNIPSASMQCIEDQLTEAKALLDAQQLKVVDQVIETVIDAHMTTCNYTTEKVSKGKKQYNSSSYTTRAINMAKQSMHMMKGGITPSKIWAQMVQEMEPVLNRVISFTKRIPGFSNLCLKDQTELIKQGSFEIVLARYSRLFEEHAMFLPTMDVKLPRSMCKVMPMGSFFEEQFKFSSVFNSLNLEDGEMALLTAVMIMCPERKNIKDQKTVSQLQGVLLRSLYTYMKRLRPDNYNDMYTTSLNTIPLMEEVNNLHTQMLQSSGVQTPQLHRDIYL